MKTTKKSGASAAGSTHSSRKPATAPRGRKAGAAGDPRQNDPYLAREKQRYDNPLPSREYVLQTLREQGVPLGEVQLAKLVGVTPDEFEVFSRRLAAMERDGQILRNRRGAIGLLDKLDLVPGRVDGHPDGFGFCIPDDGSADIWLSPREMHQVLHGDKVVVRIKGRDNRGRPEGSIVEVLQRKNRTLVGRIYCENGIWFVAAENRRIAQDILAAHGRIDILVNNAGANVPNRSWKDLDADTIALLVDANLTSAMFCAHAVLPAMRAQGDGILIHTASGAGRWVSLLSGPGYTAAKHGMVAMSHQLNMSECVNGIRSMVICPGEIATPILRNRPIPLTQQELDRMLKPEDVADMMLYAARLPRHVNLNEVVMLPAWNRAYVAAIESQARERAAKGG